MAIGFVQRANASYAHTPLERSAHHSLSARRRERREAELALSPARPPLARVTHNPAAPASSVVPSQLKRCRLQILRGKNLGS